MTAAGCEEEPADEFGRFWIEGLLSFAESEHGTPHDLAVVLCELVRGEPLQCSPETPAYLARLLGRIEPLLDVQAVLDCIEGRACPQCYAQDQAAVAGLDFPAGPGEQP